VSLTVLAAVLGVVVGCFLAGLFAETTIIRRLGERAERLALLVPGYALMKNVGANLVGIEGKHPVKTVLVQFEGSWQLGFLMDTLSDGRHVVFIPGVPRALVGTLHIIAADRVHVLPSALSDETAAWNVSSVFRLDNLGKGKSYGRKHRNSKRPTGLDPGDGARGGNRRRGAGPDSFVAEPDSCLGALLGRRWTGDLFPADRGSSFRLCQGRL
jgi:hypothetical protein